MFCKQGIRYGILGLAVALAGALATLGLASWLKIPDDLAADLFTGALIFKI